VAGCPATAMAQVVNYYKTINETVFSDVEDDYYHSYAGRNYWIDNDYIAIDFPSFPDLNAYLDTVTIGFENNSVQLRNNVSSTQIILQDDRNSLSEVVVSNQKPNAAARSRESNIKLEESEPTDGWDNYDAYLANNLKVPEDIKTKQAASNSGSVQVSFEVDKTGEPTNFRVEKSLCNSCDKEAIRLVKQGPKWKRAASKKGRTTVTINF
jgi:TonB family protein